MNIGSKTLSSVRPYVIAEGGVNHNGDLALAKELIDAAKSSDADAIKFQTFTVDEIVTDAAAQAEYQSNNTGVTESQAAMLDRLALSHEEFRQLKEYADQKGIEFLSTPFSIKDADFLASLPLSAFKVSSGDLTNLPFLAHLCTFGKPIIISTGMATLDEISEAYISLKNAAAKDIVILQCTSEYPSPLEHANLRVIETLRSTFDASIGYSDHTEGIDASVYAASLGAQVIEKHFTLSRDLPGPDHAASLEPHELKLMIEKIRATPEGSLTVPQAALGTGVKSPTDSERVTAKLVRKGIHAKSAISAGEKLTEENIFIARPEGLLLPKEWNNVLGKSAAIDIPKGTPISAHMLA